MANFTVTFSIGEMVEWGRDEFDDDNFYPNRSIQMMCNHLCMDVSICGLYLRYVETDDRSSEKRSDGDYRYRSFKGENRVRIKFEELYQHDQLDIITMEVVAGKEYEVRTRECLREFINNAQEKNGLSFSEK